MKRVSIQDLKASLSATLSEAESGQTILITRHNQPIARLMPASVVKPRGRAGGLPALRPVLRRGTKGRYLDILLEDRSGEA